MGSNIISIILFFVILGVVVIFHEFGHYLLARVNGIHVVEFAIGMGPNIISFKKGGTRYSLKLLPIGGACMFEGEDGLAAEKEDDEETTTKKSTAEEGAGSFNKAGVWARISTVLAGPVFNFILAYIVAFIMIQYAWIAEPMVTKVIPDSAAAEAGLQEGDKIIAMDGERVYLYVELQMINQMNSG